MKKLKKISALMLSSALTATCCFSNGVLPDMAGIFNVVTVNAASIVYNPTTGENGGFTVNANRWSKASSNTVVYNGMVLDTADKMESSTKIEFSTSLAGTLILVFNEGSAGKSISVDNEVYEIPDNGVISANIGSGEHTILKESGGSYLYYAEFSGGGAEVTTEETTDTTTETTTEATTETTTTETTTETTTKETTTKETTTETTTKDESSDSSQSSSVSWNMSSGSFKNLGKLTDSVTVDNLTIKATSAKTVSVASDNATVDGNTYNYSLALGGGGSLTYRAVAFDVSGESVIKVTARSSGTSTRTLAVVSESGNELATISAAPTAKTTAVNVDYTGKVYIYSKGSGINIYNVELNGNSSVETTTKEATTETTTKAVETTTKETATETTTTAKPDSGTSKTVTNFTDLLSAVNSMASVNGGGTVYINAKTIDCTSQLALKSTKGNPVNIVGVKQSDGTYPVLDFSSFRNSTIGITGPTLKASGDSNVGVRISGSYYTLENLIIEKAGDNGVQIKGANAKYNTLNNCIVRYNNDAGVQITGGASYNSMRFVYSYRNCDIYSLGGNSDGFAPKLGASTGNTFYGCYAWDNSDDGWDSFDKTDSGYTKDLVYEECACWNNGNPDVFTGKYDFEKGNALDTDLYMIELICNQDSDFASHYNKGNFSLPTTSFINTSSGKINLSAWTGSDYDGNPNGFKFGSAYSDKNSVRTVKNCLAFDHGKKGFDNNNSAVKASFENCVSFDNGYNYYFPTFTATNSSNIVGFSGTSNDKLPSGISVSTPSSSAQNSIRDTVESTRKSIVSMCDNDIIPGEVYFNIY